MLSSCTAPETHPAAAPQSGAKIAPMPDLGDSAPREYAGIHNAVTYHAGFVSGSAPDGDRGFATLAAWGVKTIISVDGMEPRVGAAAAHGIRYIHLPIGYNGFDDQREVQLVRATRDALRDGAVYIHCHHGKHRAAGAAAAIAASLGWLTPAQAVARMKVSGTSPNYKGLYACAAAARVRGPREIDAVPADFPAVSHPASFVKGMIEIDEVFEHLKAIEKAAWKTPADHPDLVPAAEAARLVDLYRTLEVSEYANRKPVEFRDWLRTTQRESLELENLLLSGNPAAESLGAALRHIGSSCTACHAKYRD